MVVPVVLAGARVAASTRARQGVVEKSSSSVSNAKVVRRTREKDLMFMQEASNDARYDSIDVKKNKDYAQNVQGLRGQIVEDLAERREKKEQEKNDPTLRQGAGQQARIYNFEAEKNRRLQQQKARELQQEQTKKRRLAKIKRLKLQQAMFRLTSPMAGLWLFVQLPFAFIYLIGYSGAASFWGINVISEVLISIGLVILIGLSLLNAIAIFATASSAKVNPAFGEKAELKAIAIIGHFILFVLPGVSMLPVGLIWPLVLWKYPN